ncbi:hypothetical protein HPB49_007537 [Dermacentor silvarum]|uniref:Uncharacterized protein n=1 Tax=Dermacentor silvarum TaxID=543639 RepID=A0ACB8DWS7_DERSI|nr:hypothetical protein HPB49_007537 [Dermacentor silvarum]
MVAAVTPPKLSYMETYNTMKYAECVMEIELQAKKTMFNVNAHMYSALTEDYKQDVEALQRKLDSGETENTVLEAEVRELKDGLASAQETGSGGSGPARPWHLVERRPFLRAAEFVGGKGRSSHDMDTTCTGRREGGGIIFVESSPSPPRVLIRPDYQRRACVRASSHERSDCALVNWPDWTLQQPLGSSHSERRVSRRPRSTGRSWASASAPMPSRRTGLSEGRTGAPAWLTFLKTRCSFRTLMVAAVTPPKLSYIEMYNTMKCAERAMEIELQAKKNMLNVNAHMYNALTEEYKQDVEALQRDRQWRQWSSET